MIMNLKNGRCVQEENYGNSDVIPDINPIEIIGPWDKGYVLDFHIIESEYLGEDDFGHKQFRSTRTLLGELVYRLKYKGESIVLEDIMELLVPFVDEWGELKSVTSVIPVPPSNKYRDYQPVEEISRKIAEYMDAYCVNVLEKTDSNEVKNMDRATQQMSGTIKAVLHAKNKCNVLLVDDLFRSGKTLKECVNVLRQDSNIDKIYVLAMTKTKSR